MDPAYVVDCLVHVTMLFTVLTLFFKLYISKVESKAFRQEFGRLVDHTVEGNATLKKAMGSVVGKRVAKSKNVRALKALYSQPDAGVAQNNKWLFRAAFTGALGLAGIVAGMAWAAGGGVDLGGIVRHNLLTFALVGVVEFVFFTRVAVKFQPAPPSVLITSAIAAAKASVA